MHRRVWVTPFVVCCLMVGCGEEAGEPDVTVELLTADGWVLFEAGRFEGAAAKFSEAVRLDTTYADAHNGRAWSSLRLDSLEAAVSHFGEALARGFSAADPFAGKAAALRDLDPVDFGSVIVSADSALARDRRFVFLHAPSFDWQDLRLLLAQSHFASSMYLDAKAQVDSLRSENSLDPGSPTFVRDLLAAIQDLGDGITDQ